MQACSLKTWINRPSDMTSIGPRYGRTFGLSDQLRYLCVEIPSSESQLAVAPLKTLTAWGKCWPLGQKRGLSLAASRGCRGFSTSRVSAATNRLGKPAPSRWNGRKPKRKKWSGPGSNRRHLDFQSSALPTELPNQHRNKSRVICHRRKDSRECQSARGGRSQAKAYLIFAGKSVLTIVRTLRAQRGSGGFRSRRA